MSQPRARVRWALTLAACWIALIGGLAGARAADASTVEIVTAGGVQDFAGETAQTDEDRDKVLMYRRVLPDGQGMLFRFDDREVAMWMKNTFIPLDMIFIRPDGRILRIAENTTPQSEAIISSGGVARGVLEVIGGTARKYGIKPGDQVAHPWFKGR